MSSLVLYSTAYYVLAALTYGAFIPSGLFTVSLIFGGCFGRIWAELLLRAGLIASGPPGLVGLYALLGAGVLPIRSNSGIRHQRCVCPLS